MKLKSKLVVASIATAVSLSAFVAGGPKLGKFESSITKTVGPKTVNVPYTDVVSYMDYAEKGSEDAIVDGKKFTYIYVWVPAVAPELGVRMMSPTKGLKIKNAITTAGYDANASTDEFFDTYITLEKSTILTAGNISADKIKSATWTVLARNDDSGEMPAQPSGSSYNSLLRYTSETSSPTKALTKGLYRVGFTTFKKGDVKGTFLAEIAAPVKLPGVVVTRDIAQLAKEAK